LATAEDRQLANAHYVDADQGHSKTPMAKSISMLSFLILKPIRQNPISNPKHALSHHGSLSE
jgi:hypothetical protein